MRVSRVIGNNVMRELCRRVERAQHKNKNGDKRRIRFIRKTQKALNTHNIKRAAQHVGHHNNITISGNAGSGKTFLTKEILRRIISDYDHVTILSEFDEYEEFATNNVTTIYQYAMKSTERVTPDYAHARDALHAIVKRVEEGTAGRELVVVDNAVWLAHHHENGRKRPDNSLLKGEAICALLKIVNESPRDVDWIVTSMRFACGFGIGHIPRKADWSFHMGKTHVKDMEVVNMLVGKYTVSDVLASRDFLHVGGFSGIAYNRRANLIMNVGEKLQEVPKKGG